MRAQRGVALAAIAAMAAFAPMAAFSQISMGGDAGMPASPPAAPPGQLVADEDTEASAAPLGRTAAGGPHGNGSPGASGQPGAGDHGETAAETARLYAMGLEEGEDSAGNAGPEMEQGDRAYRWGTVGHYALLGAGLYLSDARYEGAREPAERRLGMPGLGEGQGAEELAAGMVALHRAEPHDATLRFLLPPETRSALGSTDAEGIALGIAALREAVRGDNMPGDLLYFALPPETRSALGEKLYAYDNPHPWYACHTGCPDIYIGPSLGSDYESYLRTRPPLSAGFLKGDLHGICAEASARLAEGVAWMEGDASWLHFMGDCGAWHSDVLSEAILEYMESDVSAKCRDLLDVGWAVSDAGTLYRPGSATEGNAGKPWAAGRPFGATCLQDTYPFDLPIRIRWDPPPQAPGPESGDRAYRWGTVGHYALLGAEMYLSDDRHRWAWAREPVEWYPGRPGLGEVQGAEALAEGLVALHRAAAGDVVLRLLLPPETRDALGSSDVRGIAFGIAALREAVHVPTSHRDLLYFALPPETRDALGEKTYGHKALPYGCHLPRPCPDDTPYQFLGSDREAYLRSFHGRTVDFSTAHGLHAICKESNARLVEGVAWMEGDASWLGFMRDCAHWHSGALSEAILEYMEASMSTECRGLIDAGWRVSDAGEFYLPGGSGQAQERPAGNNVDGGGTLWKPPFASRCLPEAYPYGLSIPDRF